MSKLIIKQRIDPAYPNWPFFVIYREQKFDHDGLCCANYGRTYLQHVGLFSTLSEALEAYPKAEYMDTKRGKKL